ncbi:unnamed protein product [Amoebophrya sp. A25]|nr:unnamed protein product [Amoebophrya sp. A25]|eukprot:GSA25T00005731001.1
MKVRLLRKSGARSTHFDSLNSLVQRFLCRCLIEGYPSTYESTIDFESIRMSSKDAMACYCQVRFSADRASVSLGGQQCLVRLQLLRTFFVEPANRCNFFRAKMIEEARQCVISFPCTRSCSF